MRCLARRLNAGLLAAAFAISAATDAVNAEEEPPFGDEESVAYAEALWDELEAANLVGPDAMRGYAYQGDLPHGIVLELFETEVTVEDHTGTAIVKTNYMADGLEPEAVMDAERGEFFDAVTVMFRREEGYDPDNQDWFWAKYLAEGELDATEEGVPMAGRVQGCIGCHADAGEHRVFTHDRYAAE